MKSKFAFGLVVAMLVLVLAPSSFAQFNIQIFSAQSPREIETNRTAQTGDPTSPGAGITVSASVIANAIVTATNLRIDFPVEITSSTTIPTGDPLRIVGGSGIFAGAVISDIDFEDGVIDITLPADQDGTLVSDSFQLLGIRLDVNGATAPISGTASLGQAGNNYLLSTTSVPVVSALGPGIDSLEVDGTATIFTNGSDPDDSATLIINEGFASAFRSSAQSTTDPASRNTDNGVQIELTFTGIPEDITLSITTDNDGDVEFTVSPLTVDEEDNEVLIEVVDSDLEDIEQIILNFIVNVSGEDFAVGNIQVSGTVGPVGAIIDDGDLDDGDGYPVFSEDTVGPVTIVSIVSANTNLLVPYAVKLGSFDTGITVANTTLDPFGEAAGGASPQPGAVHLDFFPRTDSGAGTPFALDSSSTVRPGVGLSADGTLAAGGTWSVLLSELLTAAGQTGDFVGYIFIQTDFLNAHGTAFISDFATFTSATNMLVLPPPQDTSRATPADGVESLSF
jgi:hypothetical protein